MSSTAGPHPPALEEGPLCAGKSTLEPISEEVKRLRESTCSLDNSQVSDLKSPSHQVISCFLHSQVEVVVPGRSENPPNVRILESVLSSELFDSFFPRAHSSYT